MRERDLVIIAVLCLFLATFFTGCTNQTRSEKIVTPTQTPTTTISTPIPTTNKISSTPYATRTIVTTDASKYDDVKFVAATSQALTRAGTRIEQLGDYIINLDGPNVETYSYQTERQISNDLAELKRMPVSPRLASAKSNIVNGFDDMIIGLQYYNSAGIYMQMNDKMNANSDLTTGLRYLNTGLSKIESGISAIKSAYPENF